LAGIWYIKDKRYAYRLLSGHHYGWAIVVKRFIRNFPSNTKNQQIDLLYRREAERVATRIVERIRTPNPVLAEDRASE